MPECRINLAHCVAYMAEAPKSTRAYVAYNKASASTIGGDVWNPDLHLSRQAEAAAKQDPTLPVPLQIRNVPTKLMGSLGYGADYAYNPSFAHPVINTYLPEQLHDAEFLLKEGDHSEKIWEEERLRLWEKEVNGGEPWSGRVVKGSDVSK